MIHFPVGVHEDEFAEILCRGNKTFHAAREHIEKHIGVDHEAVIMSDIIIDHNISYIIAETGAYFLHDLFLMLQEYIHEFFEKLAVVIEHKK